MTPTAINAADAKKEFSELINRAAHNKERFVITRRENDIAAIVPLEDLAIILEAQNKSDLAEAVDALKEARDQGTVSLHDLKEELS